MKSVLTISNNHAIPKLIAITVVIILLTLNLLTSYQTQTYSSVHQSAKNVPLIFVGGIPRSGTTLMRAIMDAHPDVRCGQESVVIPRLLDFKRSLMSQKHIRLKEAGVTEEVIDDAMRAFIWEIIAGHGKMAKHLCNKDPMASYHALYLSKLFPNAKFVLMIRDGRAVVNSLYKRQFGISHFNKSDPAQCLKQWNRSILNLARQCFQIGESRCFVMFYEKLILAPEEQTKALFRFLDIPWNENVLRHHEMVGDEIAVTWKEPSTSQIAKPIYNVSLDDWAGRYSDDILHRLDKLAPMLHVFGYDTKGNPPNYSEFLDSTNNLAAFFSSGKVDTTGVIGSKQNGDEEHLLKYD